VNTVLSRPRGAHPVSAWSATRGGSATRLGGARGVRQRCRRVRKSPSLLHRYYDPATGSFLSVDPTVATTGQAYVYAGDNSVNESDPTGTYPTGCGSPFTGSAGKQWYRCTNGNIVYKDFADWITQGKSTGISLAVLWDGVWSTNPSDPILVGGLSQVQSLAGEEHPNASSTPTAFVGYAMLSGCSTLSGFENYECIAVASLMVTTNPEGVTTTVIVGTFRGFDQSLAWLASMGLRHVSDAVSAVAAAAKIVVGLFSAPDDPPAATEALIETAFDHAGLGALATALNWYEVFKTLEEFHASTKATVSGACST
jgi:hypothetical protein